MCFVNHTNHASAQWGSAERKAAERFGEIVDLPFPSISAHWREEDVALAAAQAARRIASMHPSAVLCQGESTYSFALTERLKAKGIPVLAACSERVAREWVDDLGQTYRESVFSFVRFRRY